MAQAAIELKGRDPRGGMAALEVGPERADRADRSAGRYDMYALVHKGLRNFMADVLAAVGRMDPHDEAEVAATLAAVRGLLEAARVHLEHENRFIHPALEARRPGSSAGAARDHREHVFAAAALAADLAAVERATGEARVAAALALYRRLALFVAENLTHMHLEEIQNNAALWAAYSDEELLAIEQALVVAIPPESKMASVRWMVSAGSAPERAALLTRIQRGGPPEAFRAILAAVRPGLSERDWAKLTAALGPLPV